MALSRFASADVRLDEIGQAKISKLAPRPTQLEDTGLSETFVADLVAKQLLDRGSLTIAELSSLLALAGSIIERILNFMRGEARIEVKPRTGHEQALSYALTEAGRASALDAMMRSGYVGPAPVPLKHYARVARAQTIHGRSVAKGAMRKAFEDVVIEPELLDRLGPSMNSGRAVFLYGAAGTGKTYISQKLSRLFYDLTLVPHAIAIDDVVVQVFDHQLHKVVSCERPVAITGGELTGEMLEVRYDPATRLYEAPLQLKANNGIFIIDDMGRQRITPKELFNRWIVPLEEKRDYLDLGHGKHFSVPFDVILMFSTNIHPLELADEAFLRRIGYKIEFKTLSPELYSRIWNDVCQEFRVVCEPDVLEFVFQELHAVHGVPLLPCHPRDLLGMAVDHAVYSDEPRRVTKSHMQWAWDNYFVSVKDYVDPADSQSSF
jgi:predicted ATPase with chaperone activity